MVSGCSGEDVRYEGHENEKGHADQKLDRLRSWGVALWGVQKLEQWRGSNERRGRRKT